MGTTLELRVDEEGPSRWIVHSDSGNQYHVRLRGRMDELGGLYYTWSCGCPAGLHHKHCRHIHAVEQQTSSADDQAAERIE